MSDALEESSHQRRLGRIVRKWGFSNPSIHRRRALKIVKIDGTKHLSLGTTTVRLKLVELFQTAKKCQEHNKNITWRQVKAICSLILTFVKFMMLSTCKLTSKVNVLCRHTIRIFHTYITANRQIQRRQRNGSDDRRSQLKTGLSNRRAG